MTTALTQLTATPGFADSMREKVLSHYLDFIPKEDLDKLIQKQVEEFFNTEVLLTVEETNVLLANPDYDATKPSGYDNKSTYELRRMAFGSKMTPFKQLVWSALHKEVRGRVDKLISGEVGQVKQELDTWFTNQIAPDVTKGYQSMFGSIAAAANASMIFTTMNQASTTVGAIVQQSMLSAGMDYNRVMSVAPMQFVFSANNIKTGIPEKLG